MFDDYIGKYCEFKDCGKKDYLNFSCSTCKKNFCKDHYHHNLSCPEIEITKFQPLNSTEIIPKIFGEDIKLNKCHFCKKAMPEYSKVRCKLCKNEFCLKHRLEMDHKCDKKEKNIYNKKNDEQNFKNLYSKFIQNFYSLNINKEIKSKA
jgi:predicted nucleic acid binding AN1-type Zn finger protein